MAVRLIKGNTRKKYPTDYVGGKGRGLIQLKRLERMLSWQYDYCFNAGVIVPSFFVVPVGYNLVNLDTLLKYADGLKTDKFAVRSSSPWEDAREYSFDGVFDTFLDVDRGSLYNAIEAVKKYALSEKARRYAQDFGLSIDERMAVIVQSMVCGKDQGVIYSKFPASIEVTKILSWKKDDDSQQITLMRRYLNDEGSLFSLGHKLIEGEGMGNIEAEHLSRISYTIEENFRFPVRIEYHQDLVPTGRRLYLLQARSVTGIENIQDITLPELKEGELLVGSLDINGQGDYTLPAVVICKKGEPWNLPYEEVRRLDKKFPEGYILICDHLESDDLQWDSVTPHKKAVVAGDDLGRRHDLDIARKKNLLYLGAKGFSHDIIHNHVQIETGDILRLISDGTKGLLYRVKSR